MPKLEIYHGNSTNNITKKQHNDTEMNNFIQQLNQNNTQQNVIQQQEQPYDFGEILPRVDVKKEQKGDKVIDTLRDLNYNMQKGIGGFFEGIVDAGVGLAGLTGKVLGADDKWAKDFMATNYSEKLLKDTLLGRLSWQTLGGLDMITTARGIYSSIARDSDDVLSNSFLEGNKVGNIARGVSEGVGGILPTVALTIATMGGSAPLTAASQVASNGSKFASIAGKVGNAMVKASPYIVRGVSGAGSGASQAVAEGNSLESSMAYGTAHGIIEAMIERISGGIGGIGTTGLSKVASKVSSNALFKIGVNMFGEGAEEVVSSAIDPYVQRIILNNNAPTASKEELISSFVIGATVSGILQGFEVAVKSPEQSNDLNNIKSKFNERENIKIELLEYSSGESIDPEVIRTTQATIDALDTEIEQDIQNYGVKWNIQFFSDEDKNIINPNMPSVDVNPDTQIENNVNPISESKNVPGKYVKGKAHLTEDKVVNKNKVQQAVDEIVNNIKTKANKKTINAGKEHLVDALFQNINESSTTDMRKVIENSADYIMNITNYDGTDVEISGDTDLRTEIRNELANNLQAIYVNSKDGKFNTFKKKAYRVIDNLENRVKELKQINKHINKSIGIAGRLKEIARTRKFSTETPNGKALNQALEGITGALGKIKRGDYLSGKIRNHIDDFAKIFNKDNEILSDYVDEQIQEDIDLLRNNIGKRSSLNLDESRALERILKYTEHMIKNYDKEFFNGRETTATELATKGISDLSEIDNIPSNIINDYYIGISKPRDIANMLGGGVMTEVVDYVSEGENIEGLTKIDLMSEIDEFTKSHKKYIKNRLANKKCYIEIRGEKIQLANAISLSLLFKRPDARRHFDKTINKSAEGIIIRNEKGDYVKTINIEFSDYQDMLLQFTDTDKEYIDIVDRFFNVKSKEAKRKTDNKNMGFTNVSEEPYFPITVDRDNRNVRFDTIADASSFLTLFNLSMNKDTSKRANNAIEIPKVYEVVDKHSDQLAKYVAFYDRIKTLQRVFNKKVGNMTVTKAGDRKWAGFSNYFNKLIADTVCVRPRDKATMILDGIKTRYVKSMLGMNVKAALNQYASLGTAFNVLNPKYSAKAVTMKIGKKVTKDAENYCPEFKIRRYNKDVIGSYANVVRNFDNSTNKFMSLLEWNDDQLITFLWNMSQVQVENEKGLKLGSEENKTEAGKLLGITIRQTQAVNSRTEKPSLSRNANPLVQIMMLFSNDAIQNFSQINSAYIDIKNTTKKYKNFKIDEDKTDTDKHGFTKKQRYTQMNDAKKKMARACASVATANLIYVLIGMVMNRVLGKKKEEDESLLEEFGKDYASATAGMMPIYRDFYDLFASGYSMSSTPLSVFDDFAKVTRQMSESEDPSKYSYKLIASLGAISGVPSKNIMDYTNTITNTFNPELAYKTKSLFYSQTIGVHTKNLNDAINKNDDNKAVGIISAMLHDKGLNSNDLINNTFLSNIKHGDIKNMPKTVNTTMSYNGTEYEFNNNDKNKFISIYQQSTNDVNNLIKSNKIHDTELSYAMKLIYDAYYYKAFNEVKNVGVKNKLLIVNNKTSIPMKDLAIIYSLIKSNNMKKQDIIALLNKFSLTKNQMNTFLEYEGIKL